jgi:hypothetical protein
VINEVEVPVQDMRLIIEADINAVVGLLLEVGGLGKAVDRKKQARQREDVEAHTLSCGVLKNQG